MPDGYPVSQRIGLGSVVGPIAKIVVTRSAGINIKSVSQASRGHLMNEQRLGQR